MSGEIIGTKIQNYRVVRQIGRGGMGNVYEALHEQIDRRAAIKVLHPEFARDPEMAQRFINEARAANVVGHPGLVNIYELGTLDSGAAYIIMEYLEGDSLRVRMRRPGGCQLVDALRIARQIAGALQAVHVKGIIHRDLKPENIILVPDFEVSGGERAKVLDFGIAKLLHGSSESGHGPTQTGAVVGTPAYMAPEQCGMRMPVSDRTDVYSLGIMLFEMLAGKPPFFGEGPTALIGQHLFVDPPPLPESVSAETSALVVRMLAKAPADRPSMSEVIATLSNLGDFSRISRIDMSGSMAAVVSQPSGEAPVSGVTTIGQATGERAPETPPPPRRTSLAVTAAATLGLVLLSGSTTLWLTFRSAPPRSASLRHADKARTPLLTPALLPPLLAPPSPPATVHLPAAAAVEPAKDPVKDAGRPPELALLPAAPLPAAGHDKEAAASCQAWFARKRYVDAIAACSTALARNPNQPAVRATLRNATARLATIRRGRPPASAPAAVPTAPPVAPVAPVAPVKAHYEKVQPIE